MNGEFGVWSVKEKVWSGEWGVWSVKCKVWSVKSSKNCGVESVEWRVLSVECWV